MSASKTKTTGIGAWPQDERPRERLLSKGAQALTDAELVAILIRVGFKGTNAVEMARQLLKQFGSLRAMVAAPLIALLEVKGLKGAKAAQLIAAMEIARRVSVPAERGQLVMKSTAAAAEYLRERLRGLAEEQFRVLYLNRRNALVEDGLIAQGSVDAVRPPLRNIVARALQVNASALIAAHIDPKTWDEGKYEAFLDELCGYREYQKEAIRTTLRFLMGRKYANLRALAKENFDDNTELQERYGSWASMERHLQLPDQLTDDNRQKFLQSLGTLRRKAAKRVVYTLSPKALLPVNTATRQDESCSAAELRRGSKTVFYVPGCENTLVDEQKEFFREVMDEDGDFVTGRVPITKSSLFKTPANLVIVDAKPERTFVRELTNPDNAKKIDAWLKSTPVGFYWVEYAWKKGNAPKRGEFSPDFFIKQGNQVFIVEVKGDEETADPSTDNIKKHEYATDHFKRLNEWLEKEKIPTHYQFNMISPKSFNVFFQKLRDGGVIGFRSDLDVAMTKAAKAGS